MPKKRRTGRNAELEYLTNAINNNIKAMEEGPKRKNWTMHDLKNIKPLTQAQEDAFHAWFNDNHICLHGSAGTGKSFIALYLALNNLFSQLQQKVVIVRSAVATRDVGFLPGDLDEKVALYELPYHDICHELVGRRSTYQDLKDAGVIEFQTTSFLRGLTWDNAVLIIEESQNMTFHEIDSIMTRVGHNTQIILTGDTKQTDLDGSKKMGTSGISAAMRVFSNMEGCCNVEFGPHDIVRSQFVKSWILASEQVA